MPSCADRWTTAPDDTETAITCSHPSFNQTVLWRIQDSTNNDTLFEGSCTISQKNCTASSNYHINMTWGDVLKSSLVIKRTKARTHGGAIVTCSDSNTHLDCRINVIHVPTLTQCKTEVNPGNRTVTGSCNIDKFFSSNLPASCATQLIGKTEIYGKPVEGQISLQDYTDSEDNKPYKQGNCSFTTHLPTAIGDYNYLMVIAPSMQVGETVGKMKIETPCTISQGNCSWVCSKQPVNTSNYVCNPSDRLPSSNVTSPTSIGPSSSSPAHLGSSSSAHYSSSQPVSLSSFTSVAVVSTTTHVSSSVLTHVSSPSSTHETSTPSTHETSTPSTHKSSSPSTRVSTSPTTRVRSPPSTRVSTSPTTHMSSPASTHVWSPPSTRVSSLLTHLASSPLVPLGSSTSNPRENRPPAVGTIVAGILVALVVIIIVIIIIYIVKRKRNQSWTLPKFLGSLRGDKVTRRNNSYPLQVENPDGQKESSGENRQSNEFEDQVNTMYVSADMFALDEQGSHQVLPVT